MRVLTSDDVRTWSWAPGWRWSTRRQRRDRDLRRAVAAARARGASWTEIGDVLHMSADEAAGRFTRPARRLAFLRR
jgi:hypothetical protein